MLYTAETLDKDSQDKIIDSIDIDLNENDMEFCDDDMTLAELTTSLRQMKSGKSPGSDGLTSEFYQRFWDELGPLLFDITKEMYEKKHHVQNNAQRNIDTYLQKQGRQETS